MKFMFASLLALLLTLPAWAAEGVNINTASAEEIAAALNGVGLAKAEEIVRYREEHGAFAHADELVNVKGIGLRTVDKNRDLIIVEKPSAASQE